MIVQASEQPLGPGQRCQVPMMKPVQSQPLVQFPEKKQTHVAKVIQTYP